MSGMAGTRIAIYSDVFFLQFSTNQKFCHARKQKWRDEKQKNGNIQTRQHDIKIIITHSFLNQWSYKKNANHISCNGIIFIYHIMW